MHVSAHSLCLHDAVREEVYHLAVGPFAVVRGLRYFLVIKALQQC